LLIFDCVSACIVSSISVLYVSGSNIGLPGAICDQSVHDDKYTLTDDDEEFCKVAILSCAALNISLLSVSHFHRP
jgi:hypothetical protein